MVEPAWAEVVELDQTGSIALKGEGPYKYHMDRIWAEKGDFLVYVKNKHNIFAGFSIVPEHKGWNCESGSEKDDGFYNALRWRNLNWSCRVW